MQVIGVVGHPSERDSLADRLVTALAGRGRVGTVLQSPDSGPEPGEDLGRHREAGAATSYGLDADGWRAAGDAATLSGVGRDGTVEAALERLAPDHDYAVVVGAPGATVPTVALGDADHEGIPLANPTRAGAADVDALVDAVESVDPFESLASLVATVERSTAADRAGAVATFTGRVRARDSPEDPPTEFLEFERYDAVAGKRMADIREAIESRDGVYAVECHHRTGVVEAGEHIVHVVVLAGHRSEAFDAVEDGIDRLKAEVPLFKREVTTEEEFWVHDRP